MTLEPSNCLAKLGGTPTFKEGLRVALTQNCKNHIGLEIKKLLKLI